MNVGEQTLMLRDNFLLHRIVPVLLKHYPGWGWQVEVRSDQGVFNIWNKQISQRFGYVQRLAEVGGGNDLEKKVMRIGGELLERARLTIGAMPDGEILARSHFVSGDLVGVDKS